MKEILKDNLSFLFCSLSIIILGSILMSIFSSSKAPEQLVEKVHETEIYTAEHFDYHSIVNRVDQIEIDIKLLKLAMEQEQSTVDFIQSDEEGGSTIKWPPRFKFQLKSPSKVE
jgi:hypothetical protein